MNQILSPDNKIFQFVNKLVLSSWLTILWFFCSIPIVTIGAATTALYNVSLKLVLNLFPLFSRFDTTILLTFKNSLLVGIRYLFCTLLMAVIYFVIYYVIINVFTPFLLVGQGLAAFLCSWAISPIIQTLEDSAAHKGGIE